MNSTLAKYKTSWDELPAKDRFALSGLIIFLAVLALVFLIVMPSREFSASMSEQLNEQLNDLAWMQANVGNARQQGSQAQSNPAQNQSLLAIVSQTTQAYRLVAKRVEPDAGQQKVRVTLEKAAFDDVVQWLANLEQNYSLRIGAVSIDRQSEAGRVNARITLHK